jgi:uncharacterized protein YkwD
MAADRGGYLLLASNGRVFNFGSARNYGSATNSCPGAPAVAIATAPKAIGYWIAFANARAFALSPAANAPHCQGKRAAPTSKATAAALDLFNRLNDERQARGLAPLTWDPNLAAYATHWSRVTEKPMPAATSGACSGRTTTSARTSPGAAQACPRAPCT